MESQKQNLKTKKNLTDLLNKVKDIMEHKNTKIQLYDQAFYLRALIWGRMPRISC